MISFATADKQGAVEITEVTSLKGSGGNGREGARMVAALEAAWSAIRAAHPDVPEVVLVVASGGPNRNGGMKWGHYAHGRWSLKTDEESRIPEVLISGEGLQRDATEAFTTLVHEAAHGMAAVRKLKDTSRNGRYHNKVFKALAEELGLEVGKQGSRGWAATTITSAAAARWAGTIEALGRALQAFRFAESSRKKKGSRNLLAVCGCGTKIRLTRSAYEAAPIVCGACEQEFQLK